MTPSPASLLAPGETPAERAARRTLAATKKTSASAKKTAKAKARAKAKAKAKKKKQLPVCNAKDLKKSKKKRRKCRVVKKKTPAKNAAQAPSPAGPIAAPPATSPSPDAFPTPPIAAPYPGIATYAGPWGVEQATRLLFRAGFGPTPGQAEEFARIGLRASVDRLLNPGGTERIGPAPTGTYLVGGDFAPADRYGHLHLDFLDRAVRGRDQLGERMTLVLHDWFAVSENSVDRPLVVNHLQLLRAGWRGSFRKLLIDVTQDPAMLNFLDGTSNRKGAPNENYARELQELFALGADRGAYTETDVRELARALTGFRNDWSEELRSHNFRFDPTRFDSGTKTIYAGTGWERSGRLGWQDAVNAVVDHPMHPSFVVLKLWSYFIPTAPTPETQAGLEAIYRTSGEQLLPLLDAILVHPDLHQGASMAKPPVVFAAGLLRGRGVGISTDAWTWMGNNAGQMIGQPPNVAGWNDRAWLNTSSHSARWTMVVNLVRASLATAAGYRGKTESSAEAVDAALGFWGRPTVSAEHARVLAAVAAETWAPRTPGDQYGSMETFLTQRQNALRVMVAAAPDAQVS
ncbi:MAG: DUF1800 family protein [Patulibacter minatonensis]